MASTYSPSLKITLMGDGDQSGLWGQTTNTNLGTLVEQAITGVVPITMFDANHTLTSFNGVSDEARNAVLVVTGTNNAVRDLIPPVAEKLYTIANNTTGGFAIRVIGASGTGVNIPNGATCLVYCDGTNFINGLSGSAGNFTITGTLAVTSASNLGGAITYGGVTLANAVTGTGSMVLSASPTLTGTVTIPTPAISSDTTVAATTAFVRDIIPSGIIMLWSGSIASIPNGWLICDGTNGTPNLRDRFVVGAGSAYAVAATGGNANATLVSHNHTASVSDPTHSHISGVPSDTSVFGVSATPVTSGKTGTLDYGTSPNTTFSSTGISVSISTEGSSATNANLPPYYALAYIMKS
jgi:microcystin-dependent protein